MCLYFWLIFAQSSKTSYGKRERKHWASGELVEQTSRGVGTNEIELISRDPRVTESRGVYWTSRVYTVFVECRRDRDRNLPRGASMTVDGRCAVIQ